MCVRARWLGLLALFCLVFGAAKTVADEEAIERCSARIAETTLLVPGDISARPSALQRLLKAVEEDRAILEREAPSDKKELIERANQWISALSSYLTSKENGTDNPLPGYPVPGVTVGVSTLSDSVPIRFDGLADRIRRVPATVANKDINSLIAETKADIRILKTRNSTEDVILIARATRWLAILSEIREEGGNPEGAGEDVAFVMDGSLLDGDDVLDGETDGYTDEIPNVKGKKAKSELEAFLEKARDPTIGTIWELAMKNAGLKAKLELSAARNLSRKERLIYLGNDEALAQVIAEYARSALAKIVQRDPQGIGCQFKDYIAYVAETEYFFSCVRNSKTRDAKDPALIRVAEQWLGSANGRIETEKKRDEDLERKLDGYALLAVSTLGSGMLGAPPPFVPKATPIEKFLGKDATSVVPEEAFSPRLEKVPPLVSHLIGLVQGSTAFSTRYSRNLTAVKGGNAEATARDQVVALAKDDDLRTQLASIAEEDALLRTKQEKELAKRGVRKVDILIVGAGLHEQHVENYLTQLAPGVSSLAIERKSRVANTFAQGGNAVNLNSTLRPADTSSLRQKLSEGDEKGGDLNYLLGGVLQLNQFETRQNPVLLSMAQGIQVNRYFSNGRLSLDTEVEGVSLLTTEAKGNENGRYVFSAKDADGSEVWARAVIVTGIGETTPPDIPGFAEAYAASMAQYLKDPTKPPRLMLPEDFYAFVTSSRNPYAPFSGKVFGVAGPGDTGKAAVRWLILGADAKAYGLDSREVPIVKKIPWYGQPFGECDAFINGNRAFYADLGRGYRSKIITNRPGKLSAVQLIRDSGPNGLITGVEGFELVAAQTLRELGPNSLISRLVEPEQGGSSDKMDYLVAATGYESLLGKVLEPIIGKLPDIVLPNSVVEQTDLFRLVQAYEPTLGRSVPIARQLTVGGRVLPLFVAGPAAGRIVTDQELKEVPENFVANTNHNWRVWLLTQGVVQQLASQDVASLVGDDKPKVTEDVNRTVKLTTTSGTSDSRRINLSREGVSEDISAGDDLLLAARVFSFFDGFDLTSLEDLRIEIGFAGEDGAGGGDSFEIRTSPKLEPTTETALIEFIQGSDYIRRAIVAMVGRTASNQELEFDFSLNNGNLVGEQSGVSMKRRRSF